MRSTWGAPLPAQRAAQHLRSTFDAPLACRTGTRRCCARCLSSSLTFGKMSRRTSWRTTPSTQSRTRPLSMIRASASAPPPGSNCPLCTRWRSGETMASGGRHRAATHPSPSSPPHRESQSPTPICVQRCGSLRVGRVCHPAAPTHCLAPLLSEVLCVAFPSPVVRRLGRTASQWGGFAVPPERAVKSTRGPAPRPGRDPSYRHPRESWGGTTALHARGPELRPAVERSRDAL